MIGGKTLGVLFVVMVWFIWVDKGPSMALSYVCLAIGLSLSAMSFAIAIHLWRDL